MVRAVAGKVDATGFVVDFGGSKGTVILTAEAEINLKGILRQLGAFVQCSMPLLMSGYSGDALPRRDPLMQEGSFLGKPFTKRSLLAKVYSVLHGESLKQQYHSVRATVFKP